MGSVIGGLLAKTGHDVTLIDVHRPTIGAINDSGLKIQDKAGAIDIIRLGATDRPESVGVFELLLVFVKC